MSENKTYRIKADIQNEDYVDVNLNLNQDINIFEFLSLKIDSGNLYRMHTSNYGCVAGRVLANSAIGVPNVKISIFIEADDETKEDAILSYLYPYSRVSDVDSKGIRYNLLPEEKLSNCHQNVGTFPSKRLVLDDDNVLEVFDKYYKFTTTTNFAGDYMIFGVPVGTQVLHMDVDLSDIGDILSQRPRDMIYKGHNITEFDNANMFKKDTNLNTLSQIMSQSESVDVKPFWGEADEMGEVDSTGVRITRKDINLNYKFEPTCVFIGSLITDDKSNGFNRKCIPTERMGKMNRITTGEGTIEMIRKTPDGRVEEFSILGNQLIDGNGTWCYQIPMNLDYVRTDEYGNIVPTNDTKKGLPTRAKVRFRFSLTDFESDYVNNHLSKMLVPNNPQSISEMGDNYVFGTKTPETEFRDLFWNKVYSVKSYIPRLQKSNLYRDHRFSGIKAVNVNDGNNPVPYNNLRIDITFMFVLQCAIMHTLIWIAGVVNMIISWLLNANVNCCNMFKINLGKEIASNFNGGACITVGDGACPDLEGWYFAPKCKNEPMNGVNPLEETYKLLAEKEGIDVPGANDGNTPFHNINPHRNGGSTVSRGSRANNSNRTANESEKYAEIEGTVIDVNSTEEQNKIKGEAQLCLTNQIDYFMQCIEIAIAQEYEVIQFDFYNDWMNGMIYIPRWFGRIRKKRQYLFGLINVPEKVYACMEGTYNNTRRYTQQCALEYTRDKDNNRYYTTIDSPNGCHSKKQECHRNKGKKNVKILGGRTTPGGGYVHDQKTVKGEYVYYFRPCDWFSGNKKINYFATDIILLGSLSEHDMDGIPQTFKELTSSSYQMPTNLAETNMDKTGYMYGSSSNGASICDGKITTQVTNLSEYILKLYPILDEFYRSCHGNEECFLGNIKMLGEEIERQGITSTDPTEMKVYQTILDAYHVIQKSNGGGSTVGVTIIPDTFEAFKLWAVTTETADDTYNDEDEYPVTESAGIDWGYTGPGQGNKDGDKMYNPGGHFLGIACFNSETNVKSCVNLSRICELGVSKSQRIAIPRRGDDDNMLHNDSFIVPTGLISKDEIMDTGFRAEFATLNHNGLKTRKNPLTNRIEYNFIPMMPVNFDGSLRNKTNNILYNNLDGEYESASSMSYKRTIENNSVDYYSFRLGIDNEDFDGHVVEDKYLLKNSNGTLSLPMYNNSYYFYFGLHDGETALDRFYKEYFAPCPDMNEDSVVLKVSVTDVDPCTNNAFGSVKVMFANISNDPFDVVKYYVNRISNDSSTFVEISGSVTAGNGEFTIGSVPKGKYLLRMRIDGYEDITREFEVREKEPDFANNFGVIVHDFEDTVYSTDTSVTMDKRGYVLVSWPSDANITRVIISDGDEEYDVTHKNTYGAIDDDDVPDALRQYLPVGNINYNVYVDYTCGGNTIEKYNVTTFSVYMPNKFDLVIGGDSRVSYNRTIRRLSSDEKTDWWDDVLTYGSSREVFFTEKAITYKGSLFRNESGTIDIVPKFGNVPYLIELTGTGEKLAGEGSELTRIEFGGSEDEGYDIDYRGFLYPTQNVPSGIGYEVVGDKTKGHYYAAFKDNDGGFGSLRIPENESYKLTLPSIYKPFFFRCLIFRNCIGTSAEMQRVTYSLSVVNGTLYENKFSAITVCGVEVPDERLVQEYSEWWKLTDGNFESFKVTHCNGELPRETKNNYSVFIKENEPETGYQVFQPKNISENIRFIGDSDTPDTSVRYFLLFRTTENGTRQKMSPNESYVNVVSEFLQDKLCYDKNGKLTEGQDEDGIYWSGSVTNAFKVKIDEYGNGGYLIFSPKNELNRDKIFAGDVSEIPSTHRDGDCFVLGIYDPWTVLGDSQFAAAQNMGSKYMYVGKDTDMLTVMKLYTVNDFIKTVNGNDIYDDDSGSEDDRDDNFTVKIDAYSDIMRVPYGYEQGAEISSEHSIKLASFNINNYNKIISIPSLYVRFSGPYDGDDGLDYTLSFRLVNTNTGEYRYIKFIGENATDTGVDSYIRGETAEETIADDFKAMDMGTGIYDFYVDYRISMDVLYNTTFTGGFIFNGGTITVRTKNNG